MPINNLNKVDNLPDNVTAWVAFTVTAYNIFHLPEFMLWKLKESGWKKINSSPQKPIITHHVAHGPKRANIRLLPSEYISENEIEAASKAFPVSGVKVFNPQQQLPMSWPSSFLE